MKAVWICASKDVAQRSERGRARDWEGTAVGTCPKGHKVREGVAFCTTCGAELARDEAMSENAPKPRSKVGRWLILAVGACLLVAFGAWGATLVTGDKNDSGQRQPSAPGADASATTATTGRAVTSMTSTTEAATTTAPPSPPNGLDAQGRVIVGVDRVGPVRFGSSSAAVNAVLSPIIGTNPTVSPSSEPACAGQGIETVQWPSLITQSTGADGLQYFVTQGPNFSTRDGIHIGITRAEVESKVQTTFDPGDDVTYGPRLQITTGPDKGLYLDLSKDNTVTTMYAAGKDGAFACQSAGGE